MRVHRVAVLLVVVSMVMVLSACQKGKPLPQKHYDLRGKVVSVDKNAAMLMVAHDAIPGLMPAMTMPYPVKDAWVLDVAKPGQTLQATLVVTSESAWLQDVVLTEPSRPDTNSLARPEAVRNPLGEVAPDFSLVNQDGGRIHLHQFHGKALLLTFIYTRCPLPDYCPLMSRNFAQVLTAIAGDPKLSPSTHLLSVSIDPEFDTPAVLRAYALDVAGNPHPFDRWDFASGTPEQIRKVAEFFGLKYWKENGQITHALVTALIGPNGKVAKIYRGNDWQPSQAVSDIRDVVIAGAARFDGLR